ncbi:ArsR family transcriptional regulator, partial [Candidatus Bathyarchaeota archaeon]
MPSYYEKRILRVLEQHKDGLTTVNVAQKADISKTTALKYLALLREAGKIDFIEVGPSKLWRLTEPGKAKYKHVAPSRTRKIESVLKEFKQSTGLEGSAVVDNEG